jgi:hypothetical protein
MWGELRVDDRRELGGPDLIINKGTSFVSSSPRSSNHQGCVIVQAGNHLMSSFLLVVVLVTVFAMLVLLWFALSSCLGDEICAAWSRGRQQERALPTTYGLQYAQLFGSAGRHGLSEQIEMDAILNVQDRDFHDD